MAKRIQEIKAKIFTKLDNLGFKVSIGYRKPLASGVRGFKVVVLDIVVYYGDDPVAAFYVGDDKPRKLAKYKMAKIKFFKIKDENEIHNIINTFIIWHTKKFY